MGLTEDRIKEIARENGAALVGIASRERLSDAPLSGDPGYLLPSTRSIVSFAVPLNRGILRDHFSKRSWLAFGNNQKQVLQTLYTIGDTLEDYLKEKGYEARKVDANCVYRPEAGVGNYTEMTEFVPDFSHFYGAVAAGLGRLGWSGSLMTPEYGAAVLLGSVLSSAVLQPDALCETNPCDRCKMCTSVCPVEMMSKTRSVRATIAGITEEIAEKRPHTCCWIGCADYHGLSPDRKWSNWSPYRVDYPLPESKRELDALCIRLRKTDPEIQTEPNQYTDYRAVTFDPDWHFSGTCGSCANICWEKREDREENRRLVVNSGVVVLNMDGTREATYDEVVELDTPFSVRVAVSKPELKKIPILRGKVKDQRGSLPRDREVLSFILQSGRTGL